MIPGLGVTQKVAHAVPGIYLIDRFQKRDPSAAAAWAEAMAKNLSKKHIDKVVEVDEDQLKVDDYNIFVGAQREFAEEMKYVVENSLRENEDWSVKALKAHYEKLHRDQKLLLFCTFENSKIHYIDEDKAWSVLDAVLKKYEYTDLQNVEPKRMKFDCPSLKNDDVAAYFNTESSRPFVHNDIPYEIRSWADYNEILQTAPKVQKTGTMQLYKLIRTPGWDTKNVTVYDFDEDGYTLKKMDSSPDDPSGSIAGPLVMVGFDFPKVDCEAQRVGANKRRVAAAGAVAAAALFAGAALKYFY